MSMLSPFIHQPSVRNLVRARSLFAVALLLASGLPLFSQEETRAGQIERARREKAANLSEPTHNSAENALAFMEEKKVLQRFAQGYKGVRFKVGGLPTGQGFAFGTEYHNEQWADGNVHFRSSIGASVSRAILMDAQITLPKLASEKVFIEGYAAHRNLPRIHYYGPGPDSEKSSRTNFRLEDTSFDGTLGVRPFPALRLGLTGGFVEMNTGPGNHDNFASTEAVFTPLTTPGLDHQSDFLRGGVSAEVDYRDIPAGSPRSGGYYAAKFHYYDDRELGAHDFRLLDLEVQQYFPFFNGKRVIALRARTMMTYENPNQTVPFYWQPVLGGSDDLRGFRPYRFYDNNLIVANVEYRWEAFSGLDMALFFDAGKVAPKRSQINFHNLETAAGFGFRFNGRNSVFLRLDFGFSHEGFQMWLKFANPF